MHGKRKKGGSVLHEMPEENLKGAFERPFFVCDLSPRRDAQRKQGFDGEVHSESSFEMYTERHDPW